MDIVSRVVGLAFTCLSLGVNQWWRGCRCPPCDQAIREAQRDYSLVSEMTYDWSIVVHLAEELAQACFLLGGFWRGGHGILARRVGVRVRFGLVFGVHLDVFFDGSIKIRLGFDVIFRFGRRGMVL